MRRVVQMSRARMILAVEGTYDRAFYDRLASTVLSPIGVSFEVVTAREWTGAGGKTSLIALHKHLRRRGALLDLKSLSTKGVIFFVDKDVDDYQQIVVSCPHLVYSEFYCFENYLYRFGVVDQAIAAAASLDLSSVTQVVGGNSGWALRAAQEWIEWVRVCLFAHLRGIGAANFGSGTSALHLSPRGTLKPGEPQLTKATLELKARLTPRGFLIVWKRVGKQVDLAFQQGRGDVMFNGKWYAKFALEDARRAAAGRAYQEKGLGERVNACLLTTLDFESNWAAYLRARLLDVAVLL